MTFFLLRSGSMFFVNTYLSMTTGNDYSEKEVEFIFNKSMITNESEKISDCQNAEGQVSRRTILAHHPFVTDVDAELKQLQKEEQDALGDYMKNVVQNPSKENNLDNEDGDVDDAE